MRGTFSAWHWVVLGIVVLVLFGAKKLPDFSRSLGQSLRIFKAETKAMKDDPTDEAGLPAAAPIAAAPVAAPPVVAAPVAAPVVAPTPLLVTPVAPPAETPGTAPRAES